MTSWNEVADEATIQQTMTALQGNGITTFTVDTGEDAKKKVFELLPQGAEVMNMTSVTLDSLGIAQEIMESGRYNAVKTKLMSMDRAKDALQMQKMGAAPEWAVGSVHAVTKDGKIVIASNTGSQLSAYVYGASHVVWVVGAQKIVTDLDAAMKRIYEHVLPLESQRANKAYGITTGSNVSKMLIINKEINPSRLTLIFVKEKLGF